MAVALWTFNSISESDIHGSELNSLANGSSTARMAYDNSTNKLLYCRVWVTLGSITPSTGGSITLRHLPRRSGTDADNVTSLRSWTQLLSTGASVKNVCFDHVLIGPFADGFVIVNNSGVTLASSGNDVYVIPYAEAVA